jgi:hypothetical protein
MPRLTSESAGRLVQGHQGPYFDYFFDALVADPARITPQARAAYAQAYASDAALTAGFGFYRAFNRAATGTVTDTPVLYLRGAASRGNINSYAQGLRAAGIQQLVADLVPDAGHFIADEQPAQLWRHIHEFITDGSALTPSRLAGIAGLSGYSGIRGLPDRMVGNELRPVIPGRRCSQHHDLDPALTASSSASLARKKPIFLPSMPDLRLRRPHRYYSPVRSTRGRVGGADPAPGAARAGPVYLDRDERHPDHQQRNNENDHARSLRCGAVHHRTNGNQDQPEAA